MEDLNRAVAQFYPSSSGVISSSLSSNNLYMMAPSGSSGGSNSVGGGSINIGGSSRGSGWTDFDLGVLEEPFPDDNEEDEEVAHPNPQANPVQAIPPEPDLDSVKDVMRERLLMHRLGKAPVSEAKINGIVDLKGQIIDRMSQLDFNPFWTEHRSTLIRDYLRPPRGGEFKISTLEAKLQDLFGENATSSKIYKELVRAREFFHIDGPFRGPRG